MIGQRTRDAIIPEITAQAVRGLNLKGNRSGDFQPTNRTQRCGKGVGRQELLNLGIITGPR